MLHKVTPEGLHYAGCAVATRRAVILGGFCAGSVSLSPTVYVNASLELQQRPFDASRHFY